jgi:hypothetical protein
MTISAPASPCQLGLLTCLVLYNVPQTWLLIHVHAKGECLYVSTLPPGVIKFVKC